MNLVFGLLLAHVVAPGVAWARADWTWIDTCAAELTARAYAAVRERRDVVQDRGGNFLSSRTVLGIDGTLAGQFQRSASAGVFLAQSNPAVMDVNGLGIRGGGICTSLCVLNTLWAIRRHFCHGLWAYAQYRDFVRHVLPEFDRDAERMGIDLAQGLPLALVPAVLGPRLTALNLTEIVDFRPFDAAAALNRPVGPRSLWIASFVDRWGRGSSAHAVVILHHDVGARRFLVSDPHRPNNLWSLEYERWKADGRPLLRLTLGLPSTGMDEDVVLSRFTSVDVWPAAERRKAKREAAIAP